MSNPKISVITTCYNSGPYLEKTISSILNQNHDDYELIIISNQKNRNKIFNIANKNNINVTLIGKIISEKGIHFDSHIDMKNIKKFDHFS